MNRREIRRLARGTMIQKSTWGVLAFWILGFYWLLQACQTGSGLWQERTNPVSVRCQIPSSGLREFWQTGEEEGVISCTRWEESRETLRWKEYQTSVILAGVDQEYLKKRYPQMDVGEVSDTMPWIFAEEEALLALKNEDGESPRTLQGEDWLYETAEISLGEARIYGIVSGEKEADARDGAGEGREEEPVWYVYTSVDVYKELTGTDNGQGTVLLTGGSGRNASGEDPAGREEEMDGMEMSDGEMSAGDGQKNGETVLASDALEASGTGGYLELADQNTWERLRPELEARGLVIQNGAELEEREEIIEELQQSIRLGLVLCAGAFLCGGILGRMQEKLWRKEHQAFFQYLKALDTSGNTGKRICRERWRIWLAAGFAGGIIIWILSFLGKLQA